MAQSVYFQVKCVLQLFTKPRLLTVNREMAFCASYSYTFSLEQVIAELTGVSNGGSGLWS